MLLEDLKILQESADDIIQNKKFDQEYVNLTHYFLMRIVYTLNKSRASQSLLKSAYNTYIQLSIYQHRIKKEINQLSSYDVKGLEIKDSLTKTIFAKLGIFTDFDDNHSIHNSIGLRDQSQKTVSGQHADTSSSIDISNVRGVVVEDSKVMKKLRDFGFVLEN